MKTKKLLFAAAALTVLTACSSDDSPIDNVEQRVPVTLAYSTIDATETRAAQNLNEGTFASDESVKVRISNTGAGEWTDYTFTTGSAGTMTAPNPAPYYPAGSQNIDIVAYYPATAGETFTIATDQTADASYKASDLMKLMPCLVLPGSRTKRVREADLEAWIIANTVVQGMETSIPVKPRRKRKIAPEIDLELFEPDGRLKRRRNGG